MRRCGNLVVLRQRSTAFHAASTCAARSFSNAALSRGRHDFRSLCRETLRRSSTLFWGRRGCSRLVRRPCGNVVPQHALLLVSACGAQGLSSAMLMSCCSTTCCQLRCSWSERCSTCHQGYMTQNTKKTSKRKLISSIRLLAHHALPPLYATACLHSKSATSGKRAREVQRDQEETSQRVSAMFCSCWLTPKSVRRQIHDCSVFVSSAQLLFSLTLVQHRVKHRAKRQRSAHLSCSNGHFHKRDKRFSVGKTLTKHGVSGRVAMSVALKHGTFCRFFAEKCDAWCFNEASTPGLRFELMVFSEQLTRKCVETCPPIERSPNLT